jgi:hypothetical protein
LDRGREVHPRRNRGRELDPGRFLLCGPSVPDPSHPPCGPAEWSADRRRRLDLDQWSTVVRLSTAGGPRWSSDERPSGGRGSHWVADQCRCSDGRRPCRRCDPWLFPRANPCGLRRCVGPTSSRWSGGSLAANPSALRRRSGATNSRWPRAHPGASLAEFPTSWTDRSPWSFGRWRCGNGLTRSTRCRRERAGNGRPLWSRCDRLHGANGRCHRTRCCECRGSSSWWWSAVGRAERTRIYRACPWWTGRGRTGVGRRRLGMVPKVDALRVLTDLLARSRAHPASFSPGAARLYAANDDRNTTRPHGKAKALPLKAALLLVSRRRPTLPPSFPGSTIGAGGLNFRVRNGAGCIPSAITTETAWQALEGREPPELHSEREQERGCQVLGLLVPVSSTHCYASTSGLSTQSSSWGPYQVDPVGDLILEQASRLYAFSAYPFRTWLTSRAAGATTRTPEVRPSRSSRTRDSPPQVSYAHGG